MTEPVRDHSDNHTDQKLDNKCNRRFHNVDRIDQIGDCQSERAADAAIPAAQQQSTEDDKRVAQMNRNLPRTGCGNPDGEKCEDDIRNSRKNTGEDEFSHGVVCFCGRCGIYCVHKKHLLKMNYHQYIQKWHYKNSQNMNI